MPDGFRVSDGENKRHQCRYEPAHHGAKTYGRIQELTQRLAIQRVILPQKPLDDATALTKV